MKRCPITLAIREMPSKTTMRGPSTPVRMAMIEHSNNTKHRGNMEELDHPDIVDENVKRYSPSGKQSGSVLEI